MKIFRISLFFLISIAVVAVPSLLIAQELYAPAPTNLSVVLEDSDSVNLTWTDNAIDEEYFYIQTQFESGSFNFLDSVSPNTTSYSHHGAPTGNNSYYVRACNSYGCNNSNIATVYVSGGGSGGNDSGSGSSGSGSSSDWVNHVWYFTDGSSNSYILNRTDSEYLDYIASIDAQCALISINNYGWLPGAGDDNNWLEFGIPDCSGSGSGGESWGGDGDGSGSGSGSSGSGSGGSDTTYPVFSNVRAENITGSSAQILWTTDDFSDSAVRYSPTFGSAYNLFSYDTCDGGGNVTEHCINLTGLFPGTYYYKVESRNTSGLYDEAVGYSFQAASDASGSGGSNDVAAPVISGIQAVNMFGDGAQIEWNTDEPADSKVYYGTTSGDYPLVSDWRCDAGGLVTFHCINLTGLVYDTLYVYTVESNDQANNTTGSPENSFTSSVDGSGGGSSGGGGHEGVLVVDYNQTFPRDGDFGVSTDGVIHVGFFEVINTTTVDDNTFILAESVSPGVSIPGTFDFPSQSEFIFTPSTPLEPDRNYVYTLSSGITNTSGESLEPFTSFFSTGGGVTGAAAQVSGTVTDPLGNPAADAFVEVHTENWSLSRGAPTDADGNYTVFNIPPDSYIINAFPSPDSSGFISPPPVSVSLSAGESLIQDFQLVQTAKTIRGTVLREDGSTVSNAKVSAFQSNTNQWVGTFVGSAGNYTLNVSGGVWEVRVFSEATDVDWTYSGESTTVIFADDDVSEESIVDFTVVTTNTEVIGTVVLPDGTPPPQYSVFIGADGSGGQNFHGSVEADGSFRILLTPGSYTLYIGSEDGTLTGPPTISFTATAGEITDLGTIQLTEKTDRIIGVVADSSGTGIEGVRVSAWTFGDAYASSDTDADGKYELFVTPGNWEINAEPDATLKLYNPDPPKSVNVVSGTDSTVNFTLLTAEAGISGTVVDSSGTVLSNLYGFAELFQGSGFGEGIGGPIERGLFSFSAPAGTYQLRAFFPPDTSYTAPSAQTVTLVSGTVVTAEIVALKNTSVIKGTLKDESGNAVTGHRVEVFATAGEGTWQGAQFDKSTGTYTLSVSSGTWYLGYHISPESGFVSGGEVDIQITIADGETVVQDLVVKKAGSIIKGQVTDPSGNPISHAFVGISKVGFAGAIDTGEFTDDPTIAGGETNSSGFYTIAVPAGTYYVKTFVNPNLGFINSEEKQITITDSETVTVDLKLRASDLSIVGSVIANGIPTTDAFVWGWSEKGGYQESFSNFDGSYRLNVTSNDTWIVSATAEIGGVFYKANEIAVPVADAEIKFDINLKSAETLPPPVVETSEASAPIVVTSSGGVTVAASGNSISTTGSVTISVTPDIRTPSQGEVKVVGTVYDLEARDSTGQLVTSFNTDVTVSIPYTEIEIDELGTDEDNLGISFWDDTVATWKPTTNSVVNKEENIVTVAVDHFTRFAIVAAADITPPEAPADVTAEALGGGEIKITWTNPTADFDHTKVYRSSVEGELGSVVVPEELNTSFIDGNIVSGVTYYYTVRAVDPAGNETSNTGQVSATAIGTSEVTKTDSTTPSTTPPGQQIKLDILRNLTIGSSGDDVTAMQQLLVDEGVYPEGLITGYFGSLTKQAVIRFQEKYADEILTPVGLTEGSGFVGASTRSKLNELMGASMKKTTPTLSPGLGLKLDILRNLTIGSSGGDVTAMQQLLVDEGVYPEGLITGYFGSLTKQAVIRFQEKYADEILTPVGLSQGSGFVGASTRGKLNELMGAGGTTSTTPSATPPGQQVKLDILRNLTIGSSGGDVTAMQQLLFDEGVYPEGLITGYFGSLTKQAVIRFQEKYADEILTPVGLSQGSGFVGASTRGKLNELLK